jgi:RTX calcium-binding nonapeptide repeat (4 copies)
MENLMLHKQARAGRLAASAVAVAAALAGVAGPGNAALADNARHSSTPVGFPHPKLNRGVLTITGTQASDQIALRLQAGNPGTVQVDVGDDGSADFSFVRADLDAINVRMGGGNDFARIDDANGAFTDSIPTTIAGGDGNDSLEGGQIQIAAENETFRGGDGSDFVDGGKGTDRAHLGDGNDTFRWDNGEGSDTIKGQDGSDTMVFNGAAIAENVTMSANSGRLKFFRVQGNVTMDTAGVERVNFNALGGADLVTVNDLSGTDVNNVDLDLAGTLGGATGDGQADRVVINATDGEDAINVSGNTDGVKVSGLTPTVGILHAEANDRLEINTLAGTDTVDSTGLATGTLQLLVDDVPVP